MNADLSCRQPLRDFDLAMTSNDTSLDLRASVTAAYEARRALNIVGGGSKTFFGRESSGEPLDVSGHRGVVSYEPTELVVTARAGTPVLELEAALAEQGQYLPFEPPRFGPTGTIGGAIATGLSGPRRPYAGAARDLVLGVRIINGRGDELRFGGEVMKNVAGYDVSRLMTGALGTLGVLLDVSLKVLPQPKHDLTLEHACTAAEALDLITQWARSPFPITGSTYDGETLFTRLSGAKAGLDAAHAQMGGEISTQADLWDSVRDQTHPFFRCASPLWRVALPDGRPPLPVQGATLWEWGGTLRWLCTDAPAATVRATATELGGHAYPFRGGDRSAEIFQAQPPAVARLHLRLKDAFDPCGILNPGRLYADW